MVPVAKGIGMLDDPKGGIVIVTKAKTPMREDEMKNKSIQPNTHMGSAALTAISHKSRSFLLF